MAEENYHHRAVLNSLGFLMAYITRSLLEDSGQQLEGGNDRR
ncbi:MAG: hypothetical protein ACLSB9_35415 [Hydrogeniiclostridium mannosilyticum]